MGPEQRPERRPGLGVCVRHPKLAVKATCRKIKAYLEMDPLRRAHTYAAEARRESVPQLIQFELDARERRKQWQNSKNGKNL